jgi:BirA family biotin operon repressor/biotin-[acetyl-CoA-carboxylase] ligase
MRSLDTNKILEFATDSMRTRLAFIKVFDEIPSTNSYLMGIESPNLGGMSVAVTTNQTAGRGRHGKTWKSPPGTGLCLSVAYTFASQLGNLPALTLAIGIGVTDALRDLNIKGVKLKWPNDLVASGGKLGGILTEVRQQSASTVTVVTGIGINVNLSSNVDFGIEKDWAPKVIDLKSICNDLPSNNQLVGQFINYLLKTFSDYEASGFASFVERWSELDWLLGREITVVTNDNQFFGLGAGVADDGALLIDTQQFGICKVTSGTISIDQTQGGLK